MRLQYAPANQNRNVLKGGKDLSAETRAAVIEMIEGVAETETITDVIIAGMTVEGATGEGRKTMTDMVIMTGFAPSVTTQISHSDKNVTVVEHQGALAEAEVMTVANVMTEEVETIEEMIVEVVIIVVAVMTEEANEGHVMIDNGLEMTEEWGLEIILRVSLSPNLNPNSKKNLEIIEGIGKNVLVEMIDVLAIE